MTLRHWLIGVGTLAALSTLLVALLVELPSRRGDPVTHLPAAIGRNVRAGGGGATALEGIEVHGHWVLKVRNPDGTLAAFRELDNALEPTGAETLARLLGGERSLGFWEVRLEPSVGGESICDNPVCVITESENTSEGPLYATASHNLSVTRSGSEVVLEGSTTASRDGEVAVVTTMVGTCEATVSRTNSCLGDGVAFTKTRLEGPEALINGQTLSVTVTISFL